jgi:hypothetical protein
MQAPRRPAVRRAQAPVVAEAPRRAPAARPGTRVPAVPAVELPAKQEPAARSAMQVLVAPRTQRVLAAIPLVLLVADADF